MVRLPRLELALLGIGIAGWTGCNNDGTGNDNGPPTGVTVTATSATAVHLTWNAADHVEEFILERATDTGTFTEIARPDGPATSYDDTGLVPSTPYRYRLAAVRSSGTSGYSAEASVTTQAPQQVTVTTDITTNTTWTADNVYRLIGFRKVANGATLTIEAGTRIEGDFATVGSSLFVLRGARIVAIGTAEAPIVFTSSQAPGSRQPGDWGGLIIVGNGIINRSGTVNIEGTGTSADNPLVPYSGGANNADNSGTLRYVRVEYGGFGPAQDNELNSFTFAAVGSGTTLEYLQSLNGLDDSFEWFGGAVDARYLVSYESGDDHFDMSEGYSGRIQFVIGFQSRLLVPRPGAGNTSADPQGIENDGCSGSGCDLAFNSVPFTTPVVANFTLVGTGPGVVPAGGGYGAVLRRGTAGHYVNGILARWPNAGIGYRDADTKARETAGILSIRNTLIAESPLALQAGQQIYDLASNAVIFEQATTATSLFLALPATSGTSPSTVADFDWSLSANSPARSGGLTAFSGDLLTRAGTFVAGTPYRGAADPNRPKWWAGWTAYSRN
ncbi:MAG: fibronectin type III domain-containing protein [Gemmatimonadales bacterium]